MRRRWMLLGLTALASCGGAGVSTDYLREEVSAEVAQILVNRTLLAPWIAPVSVDPVVLDTRIDVVRARLAAALEDRLTVADLNTLRRFYSTQTGQTVAALAYAEEGSRPKPVLAGESYGAVETALADPLTARSVETLRTVLRGAFAGEFAFPA